MKKKTAFRYRGFAILMFFVVSFGFVLLLGEYIERQFTKGIIAEEIISPEVETQPAFDITVNSADLRGRLTNIGSESSVAVSFQYRILGEGDWVDSGNWQTVNDYEVLPPMGENCSIREIGQECGGGVIAYHDEGGGVLIVAPEDQSIGIEWGCEGSEIGGTSRVYGAGENNTSLILSGCVTRPIASSIANSYNGGGYSDWFLPSIDELNYLYANRTAIGGFSSEFYWSSSELNSSSSLGTNFGTGAEVQELKSNIGSVRLVRYIAFSDLSLHRCGENLVDYRNAKTYSTIKIGSQCWMAENLNIGSLVNGVDEQGTNCEAINKYCYNNNENNCDTYGGFYQWAQAMCGSVEEGVQGICPVGWHLPSDSEWFSLESGLSTSTCLPDRIGFECGPAGVRLKSTPMSWDGDNLSGFTALPSGRRAIDGSFENMGSHTYFWSSSFFESMVWERILISAAVEISRNSISQSYGNSVRCIRDLGDEILNYEHLLSDLESNTTYEYRAVVRWGLENFSYGGVESFLTLPLPEVETKVVTNVGTSSALLSGRLVGMGSEDSVELSFQYRTLEGGSWIDTDEWQLVDNFSEELDYNYLLSGLESNTTYEYRAVVRWGLENFSYGGVDSFLTLPILPIRPEIPNTFGLLQSNIAEIENLSDTETELFFWIPDLGSIMFPTGLNLLDNLDEVSQIGEYITISYDSVNNVFIVWVNTEILTFLFGQSATITLQNVGETLGVDSLTSENFREFLYIRVFDDNGVTVFNPTSYFNMAQVTYDENTDTLVLPVLHFSGYAIGVIDNQNNGGTNLPPATTNNLPQTGTEILTISIFSILFICIYFLWTKNKRFLRF